MRIVLASLWFPVGVAAYLLRAARRIQKAQLPDAKDFLEVVTVGQTHGAECWGFKEFQFPEHAVRPQIEVPLGSHDRMGIVSGWTVEQVKNLGGCDLWIDVDGGTFTDATMPWPHAVVATDPHMDIEEHGKHWTYERQREVADFFFCMQRPYCRESVLEQADPSKPRDVEQEWRLRPSDHFLPYAYDPEVFHPYPDQKMDADVTVLGIPYTKRMEVAKALQARGFTVLAGMGTVYERYARDLCRAPVCFIWSLKDDVPCRVFEAAACGRAIVLNHSILHQVADILPGLRFAEFGYDEASSTEAEMILSAVQAVEGLFGKNGRTWVPRPVIKDLQEAAPAAVSGHTWDARLRQIVRTCLGREI